MEVNLDFYSGYVKFEMYVIVLRGDVRKDVRVWVYRKSLSWSNKFGNY